tara:strand:+ start:1130 stop:1666 length:537 start_codon:yes stop_codon:yes gene_type:complete
VALGNPGDRYQETRHNAGFRALDKFREKFGYPDWSKIKYGFFGIKKINGLSAKKNGIMLFKPSTFMNLSGSAILRIKNYLKIENKNILILLDDINFEQGTVKFREKGSAGGHNGMKDTILKLRTKELARIKIGVGKFKNQEDLSRYVLSKLSKKELEKEQECFEDIFEMIDSFTAEKK